MLRQFFHLSRAYFELDHRQAKAYLWLLLFTAMVVSSPLFTYYFYPAPYDTDDIKVMLQEAMEEDSLLASAPVNATDVFHKRIDKMQEQDWINAGLPVYLAKRISKYQHKVRPLKQVNDLYTIYGMDSSYVAKVKPYLEEMKGTAGGVSHKQQKTSFVLLDINTADSVTLESLPAIGPVLSKRILKYRELLKGYVRKEQYAEIYGISPEALAVLQKRTAIKNVPVVDALRSADYPKLNGHFYLSGKDARYVMNQLKQKPAVCWEELKAGLELKAQEHIEELKLYYPCE